jgi:organic radical activating enzyme
MSDAQILAEIKKYPSKIVIITGGEPTEQNLAPLLKTLHQSGRQIHLETNGSIDINTDLIYCLTVSPKKTASGALLKKADVIKLVLDDKLTEKEIRKYFKYKALVYLQPEGNKTENVRKCLKIIKANPRLRLSLQIHKLIGVR